MNKFDLSLYLVTDPSARHGVIETVTMAAENGVTMVQLRDKHASNEAMITQARALKALLAPKGIPLIINDRLDVAIAVGADGLHIGQSDGDPKAARERLDPQAILGLSIENPAQLSSGLLNYIDYFGAGPVFSTATKPGHAPAIGLDGLEGIVKQSGIDCVAIGGLKQKHLRAVFKTGAKGVAVVSAITTAPDPARATKQLRAEWEAARQ